ncbi:MAG: hypothetical protein LZF60_220040 [Nitrospira sp.]|nr:MAG: hypothetical protein LZF60_220040 [Nitrospira sp.]
MMAWYHKQRSVSMLARTDGTVMRSAGIQLIAAMAGLLWVSSAAAQSVSGVRGFNGGVAPLFGLVGPGNLYVDNQGTQGFIYNFGNNFESYSFQNPTTGQAWSGAVMTLGPQLSVGLIQGANQSGSPVVFPPVPRDVGPVPPIQSGLLEDIP